MINIMEDLCKLEPSLAEMVATINKLVYHHNVLLELCATRTIKDEGIIKPKLADLQNTMEYLSNRIQKQYEETMDNNKGELN